MAQIVNLSSFGLVYICWWTFVQSTMRWVDNNIYGFGKSTTRRHCRGIHKNITFVVIGVAINFTFHYHKSQVNRFGFGCGIRTDDEWDDDAEWNVEKTYQSIQKKMAKAIIFLWNRISIPVYLNIVSVCGFVLFVWWRWWWWL